MNYPQNKKALLRLFQKKYDITDWEIQAISSTIRAERLEAVNLEFELIERGLKNGVVRKREPKQHNEDIIDSSDILHSLELDFMKFEADKYRDNIERYND
jgi:hypothetical protein